MFHVKKGDYGYIKRKTIQLIVQTIGLFAVCIAVFLLGLFTTKTRQNLLTIVAILGCLPACRSAVNMIMLILAKGCSLDEHNAIKQVSEEDGIYDLFFTAYKNNYAVHHLSICGNALICFCPDPKFDESGFKEHLLTLMKKEGIKNMTISCVSSLDKYCDMLNNIQFHPPACTDDKIKSEPLLNLLFDVTL